MIRHPGTLAGRGTFAMAQGPSAKFVEQAAALLADDPAKAEEQARAIYQILRGHL